MGEGFHEVISDIATVRDRKPVHVGLAILQYSKLLLLQFVDFLRKYLEKDSYSLVYGGNFLILLQIIRKKYQNFKIRTR